METKDEKVLVLYSGGRDSSVASLLLAKEGYHVILFTYQAGLPELVGTNGDSAPNIRHQELLRVFPENINSHRVVEGNAYLIRELAIKKTNTEHVVYPIALALAVHSGAIVYCLKNNIKTVACGYSGYQSIKDQYIEQRSDFALLMKNFLAEYGITYLMPVIDKNEEEVKDTLEKHGISSNSLENKSLFGGIPFEVSKALAYWESVLPICREFIEKTK